MLGVFNIRRGGGFNIRGKDYSVFKKEESKAGALFVGLIEAAIHLRRTESSCLDRVDEDPISSDFARALDL